MLIIFFWKKRVCLNRFQRERKPPSIETPCNNTKTADQLIKDGYTIPNVMQEKIQDVFNFLKQFPEMKSVLNVQVN